MEQVAPVDVIGVRGGEPTAAERPAPTSSSPPVFCLRSLVITRADDLATIEHCADNANVVDVTLHESVAARVDRALAGRNTWIRS